MSSVVKFKRKAELVTFSRVEEHEWRTLIAAELRMKIAAKVLLKDIVEQTGLHHVTVSKLVYGETKQPRMSTVVAIMKYLGYKLFAERA